MSITKMLSHWRSEPTIGDNISAWHTIPARQARFTPFPVDLHPSLASALAKRGYHALFSHQAEAWELAQAGMHVAIVTGTASGKTLCYNLPVLDHMLRQTQARALYLFPTKALAQDQLAVLKELQDILQLSGDVERFPLAVYDGDTPNKDRPTIRKRARLVISNPDMLHTGILPHHTAWADFFRNLQYVIIDEIHAYRGVFGSHVANVMRRLRRVCHFYGAFPQFFLTSASIANPLELASQLVEAPVELVSEDGSERGPKHFLIYNPPVINRELGLRRSALHESIRLAEDLLSYNVQTVIFGRTRRTVEILLTYLRERAPHDEVRGYRSGYLPAQRRAIEQGLRNGAVHAVVATNALELGIDIGGMGAALLAGYPGTIAATWQQAGRAGRGQSDSLSILVATADPLDQYLARYPEYLFGQSPEQALINPDNMLILLDHLRCAAFELPFKAGEGYGSSSPALVSELLGFLSQEGALHQSGDDFYWMSDQYPSQKVSLRSASANKVLLQTIGEEDASLTIGEVDQASAHWMVHPGAIYMHEALTYSVEELDLEHGIANLQPFTGDFYTEPRRETTIELIEKKQEQSARGARIATGELLVTTQVVGYRKIRWHTHEYLGGGEVVLPPSQLLTSGYWLAIEPAVVDQLLDQGLWIDAPNDYGPNWLNIRAQVRARDNFCCQNCGAIESGRAHDVHHITPLRSFRNVTGTPPYEYANRLENLITLCPTCHRRAETAVRIRSGLAGLAFTFSHLAPLLVMCDRGDLGVHFDPQSSLADGQPVVVLYDQIPAGIGLSSRLFEQHDELIERARQLIASCECADGCPSCVGPGGEGGEGGKPETIALLNHL